MSLPLSRSSVSKVTEKAFDPMGGFFMLFMTSMKIFFQSLFKQDQLEWPATGKTSNKMGLFLGRNRMFGKCAYSTILFLATPAEIQIHTFSQASEHAYARVVFLWSCYIDGHIQVRLVSSNARVTPLTKQSIPQLLGALSLARLVNKVKLSTKGICDSVYWSHSKKKK